MQFQRNKIEFKRFISWGCLFRLRQFSEFENIIFTSTYPAHISILLTNSHTWSTVHELISSLCALHLRWLCIEFCVSPLGVCERILLTGICPPVPGDVETRFRFKCINSFESVVPIKKRFTLAGDALKSNGDNALCLPLTVFDCIVSRPETEWVWNGWVWFDVGFCGIDKNCNELGRFDPRFCGEAVGFEVGDCWRRNGFECMGGVFRLIIRLDGPFKTCCLNSFSFAACALNKLNVKFLVKRYQL